MFRELLNNVFPRAAAPLFAVRQTDAPLENVLRRPRHPNLIALPPLDNQLSALARDGRDPAAEAVYARSDGRGARARAAAERLTRAALVDANAQSVRPVDNGPHDARALGEGRVLGEQGTEAQEARVVRQAVHE